MAKKNLRGLCSGCGKVHLLSGNVLISLTEKGWRLTDAMRRERK